jgi:hypothetical protein
MNSEKFEKLANAYGWKRVSSDLNYLWINSSLSRVFEYKDVIEHIKLVQKYQGKVLEYLGYNSEIIDGWIEENE